MLRGTLLLCVMMWTGSCGFWDRAKNTLNLRQLRAAASVDQGTAAGSLDDPILNSRLFLPLCGNGRVDTAADYERYYASTGLAPLTLTKAQLLPGYAREALVSPDQRYNLTIFADETCDDGNRLDLDGCSADCMHMDLWTSGCEIATDTALVYEDITFDPVSGGLMASATDGVYVLYVNPGFTAMGVKRVAVKAFPASSIFWQWGGEGLVVYSSKQQGFWSVPGYGSQAASLTLLRNLSDVLKPWDDRAYVSKEDGAVIVHDGTRLVYLANLAAAPVVCTPGIALGNCVFVRRETDGSTLLTCGGDSRVLVSATVCFAPSNRVASNSTNTLWNDALAHRLSETATMRVVPYSMRITLSPNDVTIPPFQYVEAYHPMGALMQVPLFTPRKLNSTNQKSPGQVLGPRGLLDMLNNPLSECGNQTCAWDTRLGFDILSTNPFKGTVDTVTWHDILQSAILREASPSTDVTRKGFTDLDAMHRDDARYTQMLDGFTTMLQSITAPLRVRVFFTHPVTRSIWGVRGGMLTEISATGVQLRRADGKCLPSGVQLCPACQWADSGETCKPCARGASTSWAWSTQCKSLACGFTGRRLLAAASPEQGEITFIITGSLSDARVLWPSATSDGRGSIVVTLKTSAPVADMRAIRTQLQGDPRFSVTSNPTFVIRADPALPAPPATEGQSTPGPTSMEVFAWVSFGLLILTVVVCSALHCYTYHYLGMDSKYEPLNLGSLKKPSKGHGGNGFSLWGGTDESCVNDGSDFAKRSHSKPRWSLCGWCC